MTRKNSWNGTLGYGIITVPVTLASAVSTSGGEIELHQYAPDGGRVRYRRISEKSGEEVPFGSIRSGHMTPDGKLVTLTDEDFDEAFGKTSRAAQILMFTDPALIPDMARRDAFYIRPGKGGDHGYSLIAKAMAVTGKVAIVQFGIQRRKRLAMVSEQDGYLLLQQLHWAQDMMKPEFEAPQAPGSDRELDVAVQLIEALTEDFSYETQLDDSRAKVEAIIQQRLKDGDKVQAIAQVAPAEPPMAPADLTLVLQNAVAQAKAARAEAAGHDSPAAAAGVAA